MTYRIECIERCKTVVMIDAENEYEAEDKFQRMYYAQESDFETDWSSCEMTFTAEPWY